MKHFNEKLTRDYLLIYKDSWNDVIATIVPLYGDVLSDFEKYADFLGIFNSKLLKVVLLSDFLGGENEQEK